MIIQDKINFINGSGRTETRTCEINEPSICPQCKKAIKPQILHSTGYQDNKNDWFLSLTYLCNSCFKPFVAYHSCSKSVQTVGGKTYYKTQLLKLGPQQFEAQEFDTAVQDLSPQFVKIYNQAAAAESSDLDEIAGLGYRKAMEFLIKDYCIHKNPDAQDEIKALPLGQCINRFVDSDQIKTLATRATWIGNDETHYIRKHEDRDVQDMKRFIEAAVHFISMDLIYEDAESMSPA